MDSIVFFREGAGCPFHSYNVWLNKYNRHLDHRCIRQVYFSSQWNVSFPATCLSAVFSSLKGTVACFLTALPLRFPVFVLLFSPVLTSSCPCLQPPPITFNPFINPHLPPFTPTVWLCCCPWAMLRAVFGCHEVRCASGPCPVHPITHAVHTGLSRHSDMEPHGGRIIFVNCAYRNSEKWSTGSFSLIGLSLLIQGDAIHLFPFAF